MAQVNVTINGRSYLIACDDGQEAHLSRLGRYLDNRARELTAAVGQVDGSLLLVMVNLLVADELSDAYGELEQLQAGVRGGGKGAKAVAEKEMADRLNLLASHIQTLAQRIEQA